MGNFVFCGEFPTPTVTARSADANYPVSNVTNLWKLGRHYRAADATTNNWLVKFDAGVGNTYALIGIFIDDCNFSQVRIDYSSNDSDWTTIGTYTINADDRVDDRRKICASFSTKTYRYFRLFIPTGTTITDSLSVWKIGRVALCKSANTITLSSNIRYPYSYSVEKAHADLNLPNGGMNRVSLTSFKRFSCEISFGVRTQTNNGEVFDIANLDNSQPILVYENRGYSQHGYLCLRDEEFSCVENEYGVKDFSGQSIRFVELI
jgi:hypothetical protein